MGNEVITMNGKQLSVKLDPKQAIYLDRLARESGRSKGAVIQRLIIHAMNSQDALRFLGIWDYINNRPKLLFKESQHAGLSDQP